MADQRPVPPWRGQVFGKNEVFRHEWTSLRKRWDQIKRNDQTLETEDVGAIDALLKREADASDAMGWNLLNEVEQQVVTFLSPEQMKIEFPNLLAVARARSIPTQADHELHKPLFDGSATTVKEQRAAYLSLLQALQSSYIEGRRQRRLRLEVAQRLARFGVAAMLLVAVPVLFVALGEPPANGEVSAIVLMLVATVGILGAYFSRVMAFSKATASLSFDDVMRDYVDQVLVIRLIYGMIGALVFYFLMRGGIVEGTIFPSFETSVSPPEPPPAPKTGTDAVTTAPSVTPAPPEPDPVKQKAPTLLGRVTGTADFAKLLVWSFIAGFSERLVGNALTREEGKAERLGETKDATTKTPVT